MAKQPRFSSRTTPEHQLELTQLVADLKSVISSSWFGNDAFDLIASKLYDLGVRSRLHAPMLTQERVHFTSDPETGFFTITEPGSYELIMERPDLLDVGSFEPSAPVMRPELLYRLVKRADLVLEACPRCRPEHPCRYHAAAGARLLELDRVYDGDGPLRAEHTLRHLDGRREKTYLTQLELKTYLRHGWTKGPSGGVLYAPGDRIEKDAPNGPRIEQMSEVPGHEQAVVGDRPLPEAVRRVIQKFALTKRATGGHPGYRFELTFPEFEAVLAEIPDVAPRYPTIWAYEQACRTIRERDVRIAKALELLDTWFVGKWAPSPEDVDKARMALRLRMPLMVPASEELTSEVTRALELAELPCAGEVLAPDAAISALETLAAEVRHLRVLGDTLAADVTRLEEADTAYVPPARCPSCSHLVASHYEDGSGCAVTIRDVSGGVDPHCPCTFNAWSEQKVIDGE